MSALEQIAALVHRESGIVIRAPQLPALAATLTRVDLGGDPVEALSRLSDPVSGPRRIACLIDEITVKETYLLRHVEQLDEIPWPALLRAARATGSERIRIWSAGCATGEEAYSLAMVACESFGTLDPPVTILGTDISATAIAGAETAAYRTRSTRELDPARRDRYFRTEGDLLVASKSLRALVTFARHNLVNDPVPPFGRAFDLILCRNVLIYFDASTVERVVSSLERALVPGGTLILGAADILCSGVGRSRALVPTPPARGPVRQAPRSLRRPLGVPVARAGRSLPSKPANPIPVDAPATADFLLGLAELEASNLRAAVTALRRALYAKPNFGLAAFQLGRCYEALDEPEAARRAYELALRTLRPEAPDGQEQLLEHVSLGDIRSAAVTRLNALTENRPHSTVSSRALAPG